MIELYPLSYYRLNSDWIEHKEEPNQLGWKNCEKIQNRWYKYFNGWTNAERYQKGLFMYPVKGTYAYHYGGFDNPDSEEPKQDPPNGFNYEFPCEWYWLMIQRKCDLC